MTLPEEPKRSRKIGRAFATLFRATALVMFGVEALLVGFALGKGNESSALADAVLALFWGGFLVLSHLEAITDAKFQEAMKFFDHTIKLLQTLADAEEHRKKLNARKQELLDKVEAAHQEHEQHQHDHETLEAVLKDLKINPDKKPTPDQLKKVAAAFHENTDRYINFEYVPAAGKYAVHFSAEPFAEPDTPAKPARKRVRKSTAKKTDTAKAPVAKDSTGEQPLPGQTELPINNDKNLADEKTPSKE